MSYLSKILLAFLAYGLVNLHAITEWEPTFDDKPVPADLAVSIGSALPDTPIAEVSEMRRVLIFSATAGYRHASIPTGKLALTHLGISTGAYEALVSDSPKNFEKETLESFDAVILLNPTLDFFMPSKKKRDEIYQFKDEPYSRDRLRILLHLDR
ncbi:ThuA domain-containing protein [Puniceicoccaceae bacterium K14]|nr:ThuA domain-containing protein [Puniceicoccaceae bacterium K14]